jgi:ADP-heptose:LPS heptosyltransferase/O-antigen ligase
VFWVALAAYVLVLPVSGTIALRSLALVAMLAALAWTLARRRRWPAMPLAGPWWAYGAVAAASLAYAVSPSYSLGELKTEVLFPWLVFVLAATAIRTRTAYLRLAAIVALGNVFLVAFSLATAAAGGATKDGLIGTLNTGVGNYSTYLVTVAPLLALLAAVAVRRRRHLRATALAMLLAAGMASLYFTQNRQALVALAAELALVGGWFLWRGFSWRRLAALALALALVGLVFFQQYQTRVEINRQVGVDQARIDADPRWQVWRFATARIAERPWSGGGFGLRAFQLQYPDFAPDTMLWHAHNMVLNKGVQMGVPGMAAFLLLFLSVPWALAGGLRRRSPTQAVALAAIAMCAGVFAKNMTDDFFVREGGYLFWLLAGAALGVVGGARNGGGDRKILVVRRDNIGDLVCTTPLIRALRRKYPAARLDAFVNSYNRPVLENNPDVDHVFAYTKAKHREGDESAVGVYWRRLKLMAALRRQRYDRVILAGDTYLPRLRGLVRWLAPRSVVGYVPADSGARGIDVGVPCDGDSRHEVESVFRLLTPLGIDGQPPAPHLVPSPQAAAAARSRLGETPWYDPAKPVVAIHISARKVPQRWPAERFAKLIRRLHADHGSQFMLFWSPGDENNPLHPGDDRKAAAILAACAGLPVLAYPTSRLEDLIAGLSMCSAMVCSDGGAMHIAAGLGLPIVCFFGNSDAVKWRPWGVPYVLLQKDSRRVEDIAVDEAVAAFNRLSELSGPGPS